VRRWRIAALLFVAVLIAAFTVPESGLKDGLKEWTYWNLVKPAIADKYVEPRAVVIEGTWDTWDAAGIRLSKDLNRTRVGAGGITVDAIYPEEFRFPLGVFPGHPDQRAGTGGAAYLGQGKHGGVLGVRSWFHPVIHGTGDKNGHGILSISDVDGRTRVAATVDEDGNGILLIYDKNGKESARLPAR